MTAYTHTCGAVDPLSGAVCSDDRPRHGGRHMDRHDPACLIQWPAADAPTRSGSTHENPKCWADSEALDEDGNPAPCPHWPVGGGLCAVHAQTLGVRSGPTC